MNPRTTAPSGTGTMSSASISWAEGFLRLMSITVVATCSTMATFTSTAATCTQPTGGASENPPAWGTM